MPLIRKPVIMDLMRRDRSRRFELRVLGGCLLYLNVACVVVVTASHWPAEPEIAVLPIDSQSFQKIVI